jgi:hypothetical protein
MSVGFIPARYSSGDRKRYETVSLTTETLSA